MKGSPDGRLCPVAGRHGTVFRAAPELGDALLSIDRGERGVVAQGISPGTFMRARSKTWIVEDQQTVGGIPTLDLVSVEDDSQGETLRVAAQVGDRRTGARSERLVATAADELRRP